MARQLMKTVLEEVQMENHVTWTSKDRGACELLCDWEAAIFVVDIDTPPLVREIRYQGVQHRRSWQNKASERVLAIKKCLRGQLPMADSNEARRRAYLHALHINPFVAQASKLAPVRRLKGMLIRKERQWFDELKFWSLVARADGVRENCAAGHWPRYPDSEDLQGFKKAASALLKKADALGDLPEGEDVRMRLAQIVDVLDARLRGGRAIQDQLQKELGPHGLLESGLSPVLKGLGAGNPEYRKPRESFDSLANTLIRALVRRERRFIQAHFQSRSRLALCSIAEIAGNSELGIVQIRRILSTASDAPEPLVINALRNSID
jgi:hypothetical protein